MQDRRPNSAKTTGPVTHDSRINRNGTVVLVFKLSKVGKTSLRYHRVRELLAQAETFYLIVMMFFNMLRQKILIEKCHIGNVTGLPVVFQSNPHPYLSKPIPTSTGTGQGFTNTHRYPNLHGVMPSEMTNEPHKGSASVNGH